MISRSLHVPGSPSSAFTTRYLGLRRRENKLENAFPEVGSDRKYKYSEAVAIYFDSFTQISEASTPFTE